MKVPLSWLARVRRLDCSTRAALARAADAWPASRSRAIEALGASIRGVRGGRGARRAAPHPTADRLTALRDLAPAAADATASCAARRTCGPASASPCAPPGATPAAAAAASSGADDPRRRVRRACSARRPSSASATSAGGILAARAPTRRWAAASCATWATRTRCSRSTSRRTAPTASAILGIAREVAALDRQARCRAAGRRACAGSAGRSTASSAIAHRGRRALPALHGAAHRAA